MSTRTLVFLLSAALTPAQAVAQVTTTTPDPAPTSVIAPIAPIEAGFAVVSTAPVAGVPALAAGTPRAAVVAALAEQAATPQPPQAPETPQPPVAAAPSQNRAERNAERLQVEREHARAEADRRRSETQSKGVNVRIDATVIESHGEQVTGRKMLTLTLVDGEWGSVRSSQRVYSKTKMGSGYNPSPLNMDARAFLRDDGRIKVALTLEYRGVPSDQGAAPDQPETFTVVAGAVDEGIKQNVTVVLESGKPLIVAQSSDAVGDRRVALEVKATILK